MFSKLIQFLTIWFCSTFYVLASKCHDNWLFYDNGQNQKCYLFTEQTMTFDEGKDFCEELDSDLLQLDTRIKNEFILSQIKQDSWIGSSSQGHFNYKWDASDRKLTNHFTNWFELEPTCAKCCVKIKINRANKWFTENCDRTNAVICERDSHFSSKLLRKIRPKLTNDVKKRKRDQLKKNQTISSPSVTINQQT